MAEANPTRGRGRGARLLELLRQTQAMSITESEEESSSTRDFSSEMSMSSSGESPQSSAEASLPSSPGSGEGYNTETPPEPVIKKGSGGKPISLSTNFVYLKVADGFGVFEYRVAFKPNVDDLKLRFRLLSQHSSQFGQNRLFNGTKLLLPRMLNQDTLCLTSEGTNKEYYSISVTFARKKPTNDPDCLQLYNAIFKRVFKDLELVFMSKGLQKCFYDPANKNLLEKHHLEVWPGYVVAVDEFEQGLLLQCDSSNRVMRTETTLDIIANCSKKNQSTYQAEANKALIGVTVITKYNNKNYKVTEIDFKASPRDSFTNSKNEKVTFIDYYKKVHNVDIKNKDQPLLVSMVKQRNDESLKVILIPELCIVCGMTEAMKADFRIMKAVSEFTRLSPTSRMEIISNLIQTIQNNEKARSHLSSWGLSLSSKTLELDGRIMNPVTLQFGENHSELVNAKGDWTRTTASKSLLFSKDLENWVIMFSEKDEQMARTFCLKLVDAAGKMGFRVGTPKIVCLKNDRTETMVAALKEVSCNPEIIVNLLGGTQRADRYAAIKKQCYVHSATPNQVAMVKTLSNEKRMASVVQKIALQMQCKVGGEPWGVKIPFESLIVIGVNVYRDKGSNGSSRNVAAVVASMNATMSKYFSSVVFDDSNGKSDNFQRNLATAIQKTLQAYQKQNDKYPAHIIIYRDGVNQSHYVSAKPEAKLIMEKVNEIYADKDRPKFTYVLVHKRTSVKIYAMDGTKGQNPPAGTILDHSVTLRDFYDFYLIPMNVNFGTVTPLHLVVLLDSSDLKPEALQRITYCLTHQYFNWPGNIKVPAPAQYAYKLASMIGEHLHEEPNSGLVNTLFYL